MIGKKINQLATELAPVSTDLTIIGDPISGVSKKITLAQLGAIFSGAVSFYNDLASFPATGDINVIYCAKDTQKLYLWSGSAYTEVFPSQALLDTYQLRSEKGVSNGYASLDSTGKVPISQLPSSIMEYKGTWNAATNTPTLANGTGDTGDVYICNVAGTVNFGAGPITFAVGDYTIYSGSIWQRSSGAVGTVTSVAATITGDAIGITGSPVTTSGTLAFAFAGTGAQYIKGDGTLATFPSTIAQAERLITEVYNSTGATLTKGTIVYINGGQGNLPTVTKALATGDSTSAQTFGVVQADITNNNNGYVVVAGKLSDLDTQAYTEGTQLYLSATTAGTWTSTKQYAPNHLVYVGIVVRAHPTQGIVEIKIQNGYELDELHDVAVQNPDNNDILQYKTSTSLWTKVAGTTSNIAEGSNLYYTDARSRAALSFTAGSGAYNSTTGVITIPTNTNQLTNGAAYITLASLSAGAGISYNNTTGVIASTITQYTDAMARASISLTTTGTSGAATYNSTTGVLNVPQYAPDLSGYVPTSRTLTINGTTYDLSANRSWSVGTVTSVGLSSATSGVTIGSTPVTTSGTITLAIATASGSQQGLLSSTDWTTFNNKQNALTNPVTGTGTTNYLPKFTGTSTIGNSSIFDNGSSVGINTNTPLSKFNVNGVTSGTSIRTDHTSDYSFLYSYINSASGIAFDNIGGNLAFYVNGAYRARLDTSGNLGLGVTPSAWNSGFKAIQIGSGGAFWAPSSTDIPYAYMSANQLYDAGNTNRYINNGFATWYIQEVGAHKWLTAPSGTAGNAISFTQAMTLNASGNLSIGNTNDTYKLDVLGPDGSVGTIRWANAGGRVSGFLYSDSGGVAIYGSNLNESGIYLVPNNKIDFRVNGSIRLEIASTGAATFSSSVTANGVVVLGSNSSSTPYALGTATPRFQLMNGGVYGLAGDVLTNGNTYLQSQRTDGNTSAYNLLLQPLGGNVGIGTTSPTYRLHAVNSITGDAVAAFQNTISTGYSGAHLISNAGTLMGHFGYGNASVSGPLADLVYFGSIASKAVVFTTNDTERMRITSGGNVGLNTSSPVGGAGAGDRTFAVNANSGSAAFVTGMVGGTRYSTLFTSSSNFVIETNAAIPILLSPNGSTALTLASGGAATFSSTIQTASPSSGSAQPWKLGSYAAGGTGTATGVIYVELNGQIYSIPALLGTP